MTEQPSRAVSVGVLKGGVGKSTIAINLARELVDRGETLFIDLDPNGHATTGLGLTDAYRRSRGLRENQADPDIGNVLLDDDRVAPEQIIAQHPSGMDVLPSTDRLETVERNLQGAQMAAARLRKRVVEPLLDDGPYRFIVIDTPAYPGMMNNNALVATLSHIIPMISGSEALGGLRRTRDRVIQPLREFMDPEILAIVPNQIQDRMDQQTEDRKLLEALNRSDGLSQLLPSFASIAPEAWDAIDAGERPPPKPGIRYRKAFTQSLSADQPVKDFDPECDQLEHFATLADIVEAGGVDHE